VLHEEFARFGYARLREVPQESACAAVHSKRRPVSRHMAISTPGVTVAGFVIIGATGPVDAAKRRHWTRSIPQTTRAPSSRNYTKWDYQRIAAAARDVTVARHHGSSKTAPRARLYIISLFRDAGGTSLTNHFRQFDIKRLQPQDRHRSQSGVVEEAGRSPEMAKKHP